MSQNEVTYMAYLSMIEFFLFTVLNPSHNRDYGVSGYKHPGLTHMGQRVELLKEALEFIISLAILNIQPIWLLVHHYFTTHIVHYLAGDFMR